MKPRVFSGIQPTNSPTIGNYIGAIRNWVRDQDRYDSIFCLVDLHAMTLPHDPVELRRDTWELAAVLLASGIDPARSLLFAQSHVTEHSVLCWLLNTVTPVGWLNRMTQFKSKAGRERESASAALFDYPVLMAADILLYHTNLVPVGEDQKQQVELTRDVAERFNSLYGETFTIPEPLIPEVGARIMALDNPGKKMSKSEPSGAIFVLDPPDVIRKKVSRAVTDSLGVVRFNPNQEGLFNLLTVYQALTGRSSRDIDRQFEGQGYKAVKEAVAEALVESLRPIQQRYREFEQNPDVVDCILEEGAEKAQPIAHKVVREVQDKLGLRAMGRQASEVGPAV